MTLSALASESCKSTVAALKSDKSKALLKSLPGWNSGEGSISKTFPFKDYHETMAFVNAVAWIAHQQNHHPDMEVGYNKCVVRYSTHSVGGVSKNDFICAARVESLK